MKTNPIPFYLRYLFFTFAYGLAFFLFFRVAILLTGTHHAFENVSNAAELLFRSFLMGLRFDIVVSCYLLSVPLLCLGLLHCFNVQHRRYYWAIHVLLSGFYVICFFISAVDIPYFHYFSSRLTVAALAWVDDFGFMFQMIFQEPRYAAFGLVFLAFALGFVFLHYRLYRQFLRREMASQPFRWRGFILKVATLVVLILCVLVGMRGRLSIKSPIRVGTAYFSTNAYANQLALNPSFTFLKSVLEYRLQKQEQLQLMDNNTAITNAAFFLSADPNSTSANPIARQKTYECPLKANVVVVIMESMSAEKTGFLGETLLTPHLDSLSRQSLSFSHAYTAGIHTHNGIYSTLFAYPALFAKHSLKTTVIPKMSGFAPTLSSKGYDTYYFTTHDDQFDNVGGFLHANGFQHIIAQKDYPSREIKSTLGVPDHVMFQKAIQVINQRDSQSPFFAAMMTASDHAPYILPEDIPFCPRSEGIKNQIVEYADWAIGSFLHLAKQQSWFENTLFVFVADHGALAGNNPYHIPLSYHHTPLLIYSPKHIAPKTMAKPSLQIDIFPTVMGILQESYLNTTFGIDLLHDPDRPFIYFTADENLCVMNDQYVYIRDGGGNEFLHDYTLKSTANLLLENRHLADSMRTYAFSMLQATQILLERNRLP